MFENRRHPTRHAAGLGGGRLRSCNCTYVRCFRHADGGRKSALARAHSPCLIDTEAGVRHAGRGDAPESAACRAWRTGGGANQHIKLAAVSMPAVPLCSPTAGG